MKISSATVEAQMNLDEHRKYIHDLANTLSIVEASVSRSLTLIERSHPELTEEISRLKKADEFSKKSIDILKAFRDHLHKQIAAEQKK